MKLLITGGSRGIGLGIAEEAIASGHSALLVARTSERLSQAASALNAVRPGSALSFACDAADPEELNKLIGYCTEAGFAPDCLVVNAGIFIEGTLEAASDADFDETLRVDFLAAFHLVRRFLPMLRASTYPRVVIIGSTAAYEPYPVGALYGIAKWALRGFAVNLRRELMEQSIGVTFLAPGGTLTDLWEGEDLPPKRLLEPRDIGKLVVACLALSTQAVVEEIVVRPMLGDMHD